MDRETIRNLVLEVLREQDDSQRVRSIPLPALSVRPQDRLDTGKMVDHVYTRDLFTLNQSPRLGAGLMEMKQTTFDWTLTYDEIDYVIEGRLFIHCDGRTETAGPGEVLLIPKGSKIQFAAPDFARFLYVTYPADWQSSS